jgi:hypothetical protein
MSTNINFYHCNFRVTHFYSPTRPTTATEDNNKVNPLTPGTTSTEDNNKANSSTPGTTPTEDNNKLNTSATTKSLTTNIKKDKQPFQFRSTVVKPLICPTTRNFASTVAESSLICGNCDHRGHRTEACWMKDHPADKTLNGNAW